MAPEVAALHLRQGDARPARVSEPGGARRPILIGTVCGRTVDITAVTMAAGKVTCDTCRTVSHQPTRHR